MTDLYHNAAGAAAQYGLAGNLVAGANIATQGTKKVTIRSGSTMRVSRSSFS